MIGTCSHELAHYIQLVKHGQSSYESDLGSDKYVAELAQEHKEFTQEIYRMIKQDCSELESRQKKN